MTDAPKNIVIIGYMGVGKSDIGKALAARLGMKYVDTDSMIEAEAGKSIQDIFKEDGEAAFRDMETALLERLASVSDHVVSTGGGMVLRAKNVSILRNMGPVVLLKSTPEVIERRLRSSINRPLLKVEDRGSRIRQMLKDRGPAYASAADLTVDTSELSIDGAVDKIVKHCGGEKK